MSASTSRPVLLVGGSGVVGSRAAPALRRLQPELPILIGARDLTRAEALAREIGNATAARIDLERPDLGLAAGPEVGAVVVLLKDQSLRTMKYAQAHGLPYISFSDWVFDIAPEVALHVQRPASAPILLLGHLMGGTITMVALHLARQFRAVHAIEIGCVMDPDDVGGPMASVDMERLAAVPRPLLRREARWLWAGDGDATRRFTDADGTERQGRAFPMLDVVSLAAETGARSVRVDFATREAVSRRGRSVEVIIEIEGEAENGTRGRVRHVLIDRDVHSTLSARGVALATERMLGLAGGPPVTPGLYHPERLLDPGHVVERLRELGTEIRRG